MTRRNTFHLHTTHEIQASVTRRLSCREHKSAGWTVLRTFKSLDAFPASSSTSAVRYSVGTPQRPSQILPGISEGTRKQANSKVTSRAIQVLLVVPVLCPRFQSFPVGKARHTEDGSRVDSSRCTHTPIRCHSTLHSRTSVSMLQACSR